MLNTGQMKRQFAAKRLSVWVFAAVVGFALVVAPRSSSAVDVPVFLGDVGVGKAKPELRSVFRSALRDELSVVDFANVKTRERYMLSATLIQLDSVVTSNTVRATCVVSVALLRDGGTTLHAVIRGRATAEEGKAHADIAQGDALHAAVRSALTRVPQALR